MAKMASRIPSRSLKQQPASNALKGLACSRRVAAWVVNPAEEARCAQHRRDVAAERCRQSASESYHLRYQGHWSRGPAGVLGRRLGVAAKGAIGVVPSISALGCVSSPRAYSEKPFDSPFGEFSRIRGRAASSWVAPNRAPSVRLCIFLLEGALWLNRDHFRRALLPRAAPCQG